MCIRSALDTADSVSLSQRPQHSHCCFGILYSGVAQRTTTETAAEWFVLCFWLYARTSHRIASHRIASHCLLLNRAFALVDLVARVVERIDAAVNNRRNPIRNRCGHHWHGTAQRRRSESPIAACAATVAALTLMKGKARQQRSGAAVAYTMQCRLSRLSAANKGKRQHSVLGTSG